MRLCQSQRYARIFPFALMCHFLVAVSAHAAPSENLSGPRIFVGGELFLWEEFNDSGKRLLRESGKRLTLGAVKTNLDRRDAGPVYEVQLRNYFGDLLYDGQTQSGQPLETDVEYRGNQLKIALGGRFSAGGRMFIDTIDLIGGLGVEHWTRDIEDGVTATGVRAVGIKEDYHVLFQEFGIGAARMRGKTMSYWRVGARKPLETREGVAIFDGPVSLAPGREWSMVVQGRFAPLFTRPDDTLAIYYESFRFSKSPTVATSIGGTPVQVLQPRSAMDILGVQLEIQF